MAVFSFDREKRQEAARIDELRDSLKQVEGKDFWDRINRIAPTATEEPDSFQEAIARRAADRGVAPEELIAHYVEQVRDSTYPTPQCLEAEEAQALAASHQAAPRQSVHLENCQACRQLVEACQPTRGDFEALMRVVHDQAAHVPVPRILVIQDEDQVRKVVGDALSDRGYDIIEAKTGEEGIRLAHEQPLSLVLLDLRLPELDGFEALGRLRATMRRKLPIVAMASAVSADPQRIAAAGFDAFQSTPIEIDDLVTTVERLLEHR